MPTNGDNGSLKLMAIVKAIIALLLACVVAYLLITGTDQMTELVALVVAILTGFFGFSSKLYHDTAKHQHNNIKSVVRKEIRHALIDFVADDPHLTARVNSLVAEQLRRFAVTLNDRKENE